MNTSSSLYDEFDPGLWTLRPATPDDLSPQGGGEGDGRTPSPAASLPETSPPASSRPLGRLLKFAPIDTISDSVPDAADPCSCDNHPDDDPNNDPSHPTNDKAAPKRRGFFFKRRKHKAPKAAVVDSPKKKPKKGSSRDKARDKVKEKNARNAAEATNTGGGGEKGLSVELPPAEPGTAYPTKDGGADIDIVITPAAADEEVRPPTRREKCASCCKQFLAFLFSTIGLSCLMVAYTFFGGFIFMKLEAPNEVILKNSVAASKRRHVERLWNLTVEMNVFHPDNWSAMAHGVLDSFTREVYEATKRNGWDGTDKDTEQQWTFAGSMLYSITVITTIGYGHIAPKTPWGRVVTILYAIVGIPLTLLTISNLGSIMATAFRFIYRNICCGLCCICCPGPSSKHHRRAKGSSFVSSVKYRDAENGDPAARRRLTGGGGDSGGGGVTVRWRRGIQRLLKTSDNKTVSVPIYISLLLIASYICGGAVIFSQWEEDWDFLVGSYFCFITLTTIGFGDYVPGTAIDSWASQEKLILCALYLITGLALIAMCFDLMQEEVRNKCRRLAKKIGLISSSSNKQPARTKQKAKSANGRGSPREVSNS